MNICSLQKDQVKLLALEMTADGKITSCIKKIMNVSVEKTDCAYESEIK